MSKWMDKIFGSGEIRQYGEHEYYEYPRNGMSGGPGSYEPSSGSGYVAWRGPSIFEVTQHIINQYHSCTQDCWHFGIVKIPSLANIATSVLSSHDIAHDCLACTYRSGGFVDTS